MKSIILISTFLISFIQTETTSTFKVNVKSKTKSYTYNSTLKIKGNQYIYSNKSIDQEVNVNDLFILISDSLATYNLDTFRLVKTLDKNPNQPIDYKFASNEKEYLTFCKGYGIRKIKSKNETTVFKAIYPSMKRKNSNR